MCVTGQDIGSTGPIETDEGIDMPPMKARTGVNQIVREAVRQGYATIATSGGSCCGQAKSCCGSADPDGVAKAVGYSENDLAALPDGANMGLSCGNPGAITALKRGEVVLDLGSGGGFDVFLVAKKVGPKGHVIGVDMTPEMLTKARANGADFLRRAKLNNFEFRLGEIEHLPVADSSIDVVISNCVINLSPDKPQVWREIARVLKPGGRVAVADLALLRPLPKRILESVEALIGCVAGAVLVDRTRAMARAAGLIGVRLTPKAGYVDSMVDWNDSLYLSVMKQLPAGTKMSDFITSLEVEARKPMRRIKR
jgi:SAM-dependent methyltransferase